MSTKKFYICKTCGNLIEKIEDSRVPVMCCGKPMEELVPNTVEASGEKHLPVYALNNNLLEVKVGSVLHPMIEVHNIMWVYVETEKGSQLKRLEVNKDPVVSFSFVDDKPVAIYAYCNLHGLWRSDIK